jgi:hypothetical protein
MSISSIGMRWSASSAVKERGALMLMLAPTS